MKKAFYLSIGLLKDAGLIEGEITPPKVRYCINRVNYDMAKLYFDNLFI